MIRGQHGRGEGCTENLNCGLGYTHIDYAKVLEQNCFRSKGRFCI